MADAEAGFAPPAAAEGAPAPAPKKRTTVREWSTTKLTRTLRLVNLCNGIILILLGVLVFVTGLMSVSFTSVTVSAYVVFFGTLLSCLECNLSFLSSRFKRNFGFMFSYLGRTGFIVFSGTMALSMANIPGYLVGAATMLNGIFNGYIICVHPAFKSGELSAKGDPYGGYTGGEGEMLSYLRSKPELATKAGAAAAAFAKENPGAAMSVMGAVAQSQQAQAGAAAHVAPGEGSNPWG